MKVVIAEPVADRLKELIEERNKDWVVYIDSPKDNDELVERIKDAGVVTSYSIKYTEDIFSRCPKLKYLAIPAVGAGYYVDMVAAKKYGVTVMNCPGYNSLAVAEMAVGLAIDVLRNIPQVNSKLNAGDWLHDVKTGRLLSGKKVALIGYGNVGKSIQSLLKDWATQFEIINSQSKPEDIDKAVSTCDVIFLCCPLNDKTKGMISAKRLTLMKDSAVIINVARGAVVNEDELYKRLKTGRLAGAGIDVFIDEPEPGDELPDSIRRFTELETVICTPHIAGSTLETRLILGEIIFEDIESCLSGKPINLFE